MTQDDDSGRYRYRAFISYRHHKQPAFVRRLELALKQYAKPLFRPPMRIFRDENHLSPGVDLPELIKSALDESEFLILLASPEAAASGWVQDEPRYWCGTLLRTDRLLIVLVDGIVVADESQQHMDWDRTTALPAMLRPFLARVPFYVDLRWATHDNARSGATESGNRQAAKIEDARLEPSLFDGCMRLEWLASPSLYRLPVEPGCSDARELEEIPFDGGFTSAAFCGPGDPYVTGSHDGDVRWWRPSGVREVEQHALEHVERSWNDSVNALRCTSDGVIYAGFRATGIRKYRNRFRVVTERSTASTRDSFETLSGTSVDWLLQTPVRGSRMLRLIGSRGRLELVGQSAPVWSRQVANTIPYRTGSSVDAVVAVAIDESRARVWVMTSYGTLRVIDMFTGSPIATLGTVYNSAAPVTDSRFSGLLVDHATGDVQFRHQFHYDWFVRVSAVGEP